MLLRLTCGRSGGGKGGRGEGTGDVQGLKITKKKTHHFHHSNHSQETKKNEKKPKITSKTKQKTKIAFLFIQFMQIFQSVTSFLTPSSYCPSWKRVVICFGLHKSNTVSMQIIFRKNKSKSSTDTQKLFNILSY
jgi:hypothetical protein